MVYCSIIQEVWTGLCIKNQNDPSEGDLRDSKSCPHILSEIIENVPTAEIQITHIIHHCVMITVVVHITRRAYVSYIILILCVNK